MRTVNAKCGAVIPIGRLGENEATAVVFDVAEWIALFGAGTFSLLHQRAGDPAPYPCSIEHDGNTVTWTVTSADLGVQGYGKCELVYTVGGTVAKSVIYTTITGAALAGGAEPPEPWEDWVQRVLAAGQRVEDFLETLEGGEDGQVWTKHGETAHWADPHDYNLRRLGDYLYEIAFRTIPDAPAGDFVPGACSSYVQDGKLYRNLDWDYSDLASFHVLCPGFEGMAFLPGLTDTEQTDALLRQLPRRVVDGKNAHGIMCSTHILYNDWDWHGSGSTPITELVYLILTNVKSMATISDDLADILPDLCSVPALDALGYTAQFLVTDGTTTVAILPPTTASGDFSIVDITDNPKLTNFRWVPSATVDRADLQQHPTGVERWNMMPCELSDLRFTAAYEAPTRLSEFIGIDGTDKDSTDAELEAIYDTAHAAYLDRERDGTTWQTMHSVVYSALGMEHLWVQENWSKDYVAQGGGGGTDDFDLLTNRPYYNGTVMNHGTRIPQVKTETWDAKYNKPTGGIPKTDLASAVQQSLNKADSAIQSLEGYATEEFVESQGFITEDDIPVTDVTINGDSIIDGTVAKIVYETGLGEDSDNAATVSAIRAFVNSSVEAVAAYYITADTAGNAFATKAALDAGPYYYAGQLRSPTRNDYAIVVADETHGGQTARYTYVKNDGTLTGQWAFQYTFNMTFTQAQVNAINSGITAAKVASYDTHIADTSNPHQVTKEQVGLGNVGNFKAVSTVASQGLNETEKTNARTNMGAGTYSKPTDGIPATDFTEEVQDTLDKVDTALQEPTSGLAVGKWFRVASIDDDGHAVLEAVDAPAQNMKITSSVAGLTVTLTPDENGNISIPFWDGSLAGYTTPLQPFFYTIDNSGFLTDYNNPTGYHRLRVKVASASGIANRSAPHVNGSGVINNANYDLAVKHALTDGVGPAWTDGEKQAARERIGVQDITIDQTYNPESANAQSGTAVAQAVGGVATKLKLAGTVQTPDQDGYVNVPYTNSFDTIGLVKVVGQNGLMFKTVDGEETMAVYSVAEASWIINARRGARINDNSYIPSSQFDLWVKRAMTDEVSSSRGLAWTDAEKTGAWKRLNSIKTTLDAVAVAGAQYYLGEQSEVDIVMPTNAEVGQQISVVFYSGATATTLTISGDTIGEAPTPAANQRVEINMLWDGSYWAIVSNVLAVPVEETV